MKISIPNISQKWIWFIVIGVVVVIGAANWNRWFHAMTAWIDVTIDTFRSGQLATDEEPHPDDDSQDEHDHHHDGDEHEDHGEETSLKLSDQALRNIGLTKETIRPVELETFRKSITVPALIVERPGRTRVQVSTPMTGVITHVHAVKGEAVDPGTLLFQIRLTHEDLVNAQTEYMKTLGELDVENREIERLQDITQSGAVAGKRLLEREYARDKLTALMRAQGEALRLHGLSDEQVELIASERRLLRELQVFAPTIDDHSEHAEPELNLTQKLLIQTSIRQNPKEAVVRRHAKPLIIQELNVHKGQSVSAGETLCVLADYDELYIEGMAFEQDVNQLRRASEQGWTTDAVFQTSGSDSVMASGLKFVYLANDVDPDSRTLRFYVRLPNEISKEIRDEGYRYIEWKYLLGQRLQLRVPVEEWQEQIVLPVDAVAREGAESFVFRQNGDHFDRVPVHVKYSDQYSSVIENDGSLFPGDVVAMRGAHQMQMALKNKSGGGVDPHAGHHH